MKGGLAGSKLVARLQRERAQCGAAAAGRRGQAVQHALVSSTKEQQVVAKEVKRAMQQSAALVAASLERLQVAEAAWDRDVQLNGVAVDGFPTVEQVLTFIKDVSGAAAHVPGAAWRPSQGSAKGPRPQLRRRVGQQSVLKKMKRGRHDNEDRN